MNVLGHYVGLELSELERIKTEVLQALEKARKGTQFVEVDMGGNKGKKLLLEYPQLVHELKEVNYALKKALPDVYGKATKRIVPNFNKVLIQMTCKPNDGLTHYLVESNYVEAGATAYDPVEGTLVAERITTPDMKKLGEQKIIYQATNSKGEKVQGIRIINITGTLYVRNLAHIYGNIVNDDHFEYKDQISTITLTRGYFYDKDYQNQIAKDEQGKWHIYDYSGMIHDSQSTLGTSPLSLHGEWSTVHVSNEYIR